MPIFKSRDRRKPRNSWTETPGLRTYDIPVRNISIMSEAFYHEGWFLHKHTHKHITHAHTHRVLKKRVKGCKGAHLNEQEVLRQYTPRNQCLLRYWNLMWPTSCHNKLTDKWSVPSLFREWFTRNWNMCLHQHPAYCQTAPAPDFRSTADRKRRPSKLQCTYDSPAFSLGFWLW